VNSKHSFGLFGAPSPDLAVIPAGAVQTSPLIPGGVVLEDLPSQTLAGMTMAALPGTVERLCTLALTLRTLKPGAPFTVMAPKTKGGNRIAKELGAFGCQVETSSRRHQRICQTTCPANFGVEANGLLEAAIAAGAPRFMDDIGLWTQPGIFSWDRLDPGTALLMSQLPSFAGRGADLGCGIGVLARAVLASPHVSGMDMIDVDRRAVAAARRNVADPRAAFHWADVRHFATPSALDFVVMNPPFHDGGVEDRALGEAFVRQGSRLLRAGGSAWLVANRHLPYESVLSAAFSRVVPHAERDGFKIYEATK
jgi:16S rRNA (guanine1207-N2)-methyltransferase